MSVTLTGNFLKYGPGLIVPAGKLDAATNTLYTVDTDNNFADDAAAAAGGVPAGGLYHNNGAVRVRLT